MEVGLRGAAFFFGDEAFKCGSVLAARLWGRAAMGSGSSDPPAAAGPVADPGAVEDPGSAVEHLLPGGAAH